ncbi:MAG TPA: hypothetical protein VGG02_07450 [Chthoniobacterales bacterium]|jgi:hypothetical protein
MPNDDDLLHPDQPRFLLGTWLWAVALFVFFGAIVAITFGAMHHGSTYEVDRSQVRMEKLKTAREEWTKTANTYGWVDQAKGVAHIPVQRAMQLELVDLKEKKPTAAGPIATPEPSAVPVSATGASPPKNPSAVAAPSVSPTPKATSVEGLNSEIRGQPTGVANPPNAASGTQPGANATPAAAPQAQTEIPPVSPTATPVQRSSGAPLPVAGKTPPPRP